MNEEARNMLPTVNARIYPRGGLDVLSRAEVARLRDASAGGMHDLLRRCALAVLTSGSASDDPRAAQELYPDFDIQVLQQDRGVRIDLRHAPAMAFVDGEIIRGVAELLFAVVRDLAYTAIELGHGSGRDLRQQRRHHRRGVRPAAQRARAAARPIRTWWCAGAATRSAATSTSTPSRSATSWACAASTSAPAAARAR